jgi:hypothetical protein
VLALITAIVTIERDVNHLDDTTGKIDTNNAIQEERRAFPVNDDYAVVLPENERNTIWSLSCQVQC